MAVKDPPLPIAPSRLEIQSRLKVRSPSSTSLAAPAKLTAVPSSKTDPSSGAVIVTVGAVLTVTLMEADPLRPPLSLTEAVMVWVPAESVLEKDPPLPIKPSKVETQLNPKVRSPSSGSLAAPAKLIEVPLSKTEPSTGAVIVTEGAALTVTVMEAEPLKPPLSVT